MTEPKRLTRKLAKQYIKDRAKEWEAPPSRKQRRDAIRLTAKVLRDLARAPKV
jgi:hypothetical protein